MSANSPFEKVAQSARPNLFTEFWQFVMNTKKWWLIPVLFVLLLLGLMMILSNTALAPYVYTLF